MIGLVLWPTALSAQTAPAPSGSEPVPTEPQPIQPGSKNGTVQCITPADCDDGNACTEDDCLNGQCVHAPIPGCVPCTPQLSCQPVDVVFIMDTSGSMKDESAALCGAIDAIVADLQSQGVSIRRTVLGITETPGSAFSCLTDNVVNLLGGEVPRNPDACPFPNEVSSFESWGPATAIVARRFPWQPGSRRIIVPISDEGPCNGNRPDGCNDPGDDRDALENAITEAIANRAAISPITGTGSNACVLGLADSAASATGGTHFDTQDAGADFPHILRSILLSFCTLDTACDDGDLCTCGDTCIDGVCQGTPVGGGCKPCNPTGVCDDGNACTTDTCVGLECVVTLNYDPNVFVCDPQTGELTPIDDLDDGNPCTELQVDPCTGEAINVPVPNWTPCDDGLACTVGEVCIDGTCQGGVEPDCSELNNTCHVGVCDETVGGCVAIPANEGQPCDDGDLCTAGDLCTNGTCLGEPVICDDGNVCTDDACDPAIGCVYTNNTLPCDDGDACTVGDVCAEGECQPGGPRDCDDGNVCTDDACDPRIGCVHAENTLPCDDGNACTTNDTCLGGICTGLDPVDCDDGNPCTDDACDPRTGCVHVDNTLPCDDGDPCTV
ncbi:MAG: hypothetical protein D6788_05105, partial [Planctomycetota bacterium]